MFSKRQKDIITVLSKVNESITSEWIAREIGVSDRTVRNDIKFIQKESSVLGIEIQSLRGKGYILKIIDRQRFLTAFGKLISESNTSLMNYADQENRVNHMLTQLLLTKSFIKLEKFSDELFVSPSTIQNDLKVVREILKKYNLRLMNRPYYGTKVDGDEYMKRQCLSNAVLNRSNDLFVDSDSFQFLNEELYEKVKRSLIAKLAHYHIEISDIALTNLATHITIACRRVEEGLIIEQFEDGTINQYPFEKMVASEILQEVERFTGLTFPHTERDYISIHLLGTKLLNEKELQEISEYDEVGRIVRTILERLKAELNWDFSDDIEFIQALTLHIRPAINRLKYKMNIRNPLLNEIKTKYPIAFDGAIIASKCIEEHIKIEVIEHEIAYIALHIGVALERKKTRRKELKRVLVVCASGVGSAKLLYYRLKNHFEREVEIVDTINYYNLVSYNLASIDLIISTIPIQESMQVPVLVVNPFLDDADKQKISCFLKEDMYQVESYLHPERVFIHQDLRDKFEVINFLCQQLYVQGLVSSDYVNLVLEREALAPTCFGELVAIPHPMTPVTKETFWTICTLKRPIKWHKGQMVQFVCLLNIRKGGRNDLDQMYQKLIAIIDNRTMLQRLIASKSFEEMLPLLKAPKWPD
ncbi:BglG family transcription antiterminator [Robertmurraya sp. DFI.2.37]|uniref:BglG family transcription antiterminator n=1 Tax=Robertmurraya sp. DFI.2.37 TaxID=3031819 RepID=UPI00124474C8|nr:BglG family transcription antiterminator [Robertmurraya sp. DFI.2.37]MDF1509405.1 BglG family transcription antiterminator [Robertmurraya sp. DFI.2.37]